MGHQGHPDDLCVLMDLIINAPLWLRANGELWIVTQEHIPAGRLFALAEKQREIGSRHFVLVEMMPTKDGRFTVWRAIASGIVGLTGEVGDLQPNESTRVENTDNIDPTMVEPMHDRKRKHQIDITTNQEDPLEQFSSMKKRRKKKKQAKEVELHEEA